MQSETVVAGADEKAMTLVRIDTGADYHYEFHTAPSRRYVMPLKG